MAQTVRDRRDPVSDDSPDGPAAMIAKALDDLMRGSDVDVADAAGHLLDMTDARDLEYPLVEAIRNDHGERRLAGIRLFGEIGTPRSLPLLLALADHAETRPAALPGVIRLADAPRLAAMARSEPDAANQRRMLRRLSEIGSPDAMPLYLQFVADRETRAVALDAIEDAADPPVDALMATLRDSHISMRWAAARALGRVAEPSVIDALAEMVAQDVGRREAVITLLSSDSPLADDALRAASRYPGVSAAIESIRMQLHGPPPKGFHDDEPTKKQRVDVDHRQLLVRAVSRQRRCAGCAQSA